MKRTGNLKRSIGEQKFSLVGKNTICMSLKFPKRFSTITIRDLDEALIEYWKSGRIAKLIEMPEDMIGDFKRILIGLIPGELVNPLCYAGIPVREGPTFQISDRDIFACGYCGTKKDAERENCQRCGAANG